MAAANAKRPRSGWNSLTATELDVVRLVSEGLTNKDIATRLFISPRSVQTHLTDIYNKLGIASRVQLVEEFTDTPLRDDAGKAHRSAVRDGVIARRRSLEDAE